MLPHLLMQNGVRLTFAAALVSASVASFVGYSLISQPDSPHPEAIRDSTMACGPESLWVATSRLGLPVERSDFESIPVDPKQGSSMRDLLNAAQKLGLVAEYRKMHWEELARFHGCAILWLNGNHFVMADPRERATADTNARLIRVYDPLKNLAAQWVSQESIGGKWSGDCLLLHQPGVSSAMPEPAIEFKECWIDAGTVREGSVVHYSIDFENRGGSPLTLEVSDKSCSCTSAKIGEPEVSSGGSGKVEVSIDIGGRRGQFAESVTLSTNDPLRNKCRLVFTGIAASDRELLSAKSIHCGSVAPNTAITRRFFVHDPGEGKLAVTGVAVIDDSGTLNEDFSIDASVARIESNSPLLGTPGKYRTSAGDYVVTFKISAKAECSPRKWDGRIEVHTNIKEASLLSAQIRCIVPPDIRVEPEALLLSNDHRKKEINVFRHSGRPVRIERVDSIGDLPIKVHLHPTDRAGTRVDVHFEGNTSGGASRRGLLHALCVDGAEMSIPVIIQDAPPQ